MCLAQYDWIVRSRPTRGQLKVWRAFLEAHHAITNTLSVELEVSGLSIGFYDVLVQLTEAGTDGLRMADLARRVLISKSGLTRLIDRMNGAGLVVRVPSPEDARGLRVLATPEGRAALRWASPIHLRGIATHFTSLLSEHELAVIGEALARVTRAASTAGARQFER